MQPHKRCAADHLHSCVVDEKGSTAGKLRYVNVVILLQLHSTQSAHHHRFASTFDLCTFLLGSLLSSSYASSPPALGQSQLCHTVVFSLSTVLPSEV